MVHEFSCESSLLTYWCFQDLREVLETYWVHVSLYSLGLAVTSGGFYSSDPRKCETLGFWWNRLAFINVNFQSVLLRFGFLGTSDTELQMQLQRPYCKYTLHPSLDPSPPLPAPPLSSLLLSSSAAILNLEHFSHLLHFWVMTVCFSEGAKTWPLKVNAVVCFSIYLQLCISFLIVFLPVSFIICLGTHLSSFCNLFFYLSLLCFESLSGDSSPSL